MSAVVIDLNDVAPIRAERPRFDVDLIVARLRDTAETLGAAALPERAAPRRRMAAGQHPRRRAAQLRSCVITLRGAHAGDWIDFDGNHGGGPIGAIEQATGLTGYELIAEAAEIAGVTPGAPPRRVPAFQPAPRRDPAQEIGHILAHAVPATGTPAERYLAARGLVLPDATPTCCSTRPDPAGEQVGLPRADRPGATGTARPSACTGPISQSRRAERSARRPSRSRG